MPKTMRLTQSIALGDVTVSKVVDVTGDNLAGNFPTVAAAKVGQLTTRTDNTTGTLTMNGGHGIATGNRIGVYWAGGSRQNVVVGTVSTDSVPISGGSGDNLPTNNTAITAMVIPTEEQGFSGDNCKAIVLNSNYPGHVTVLQSDGTTVIATFPLTLDSQGLNYTYLWYDGSGVTNPLASAAVSKIGFAHGDSTASHPFSAQFLRD